MNFANLWRVLFVACFSFFIAACKPIPSFTYSPDPVVVGQAIAFEATTLTGDHDDDEDDEDHDHEKKHKTKKVIKKLKKLTFNWNFGDGGTATGLTATHTFTEVGSKTVTLTVSNRKGESAVVSKVIAVLPATTTTTAALTVLVQGADGVRVNGAQIKIGSNAVATNTTDANGVAIVSSSSTGTQTVVVSKPGYITQALNANLATTAAANLNFILLPVKEVKTIANIEQAQLITAQTLGASVLLPANALVDSAGNAVTGTVVLELTPWDVSGSDLNAMLGNGNARGADGTTGNLISAGMMTVDFFKVAANGTREHLQLDSAKTKTAVIQMDIPYFADPNTGLISINGTVLDPHGINGTNTIPMWTFDQAQGIWVEEGLGTVVPSNNAPSYIAVKATVKHFSTWNWDFKFNNGGTVTVQCKDGTVTVACSILAEVTLPDGSRFTKSSYSVIDVVTTVINMPSDASIVWTGSTPGGQIGVATSGAFGNVVITMSPPKTDHYVQCTVPGGASIACDVQLTATPTANPAITLNYSLPAEGGPVRTNIDTTAPLVWTARSRIVVEGTELVRYEGNTTSNANGIVPIPLSRVVLSSKTVYVACETSADVFNYGGSGSGGGGGGVTGTFALDSCTINAYAYDYATQQSFYSNQVTVPSGTLVPVVLPAFSNTNYVYIYAGGQVQTPTTFYYVDRYVPSPDPTRSLQYGDLTNNQSISIRLVGGIYGCDGNCLP